MKNLEKFVKQCSPEEKAYLMNLLHEEGETEEHEEEEHEEGETEEEENDPKKPMAKPAYLR